MKIRVLSDLHIDVNRDYPISLDSSDVFTVVAGDTAGSPDAAIQWIKSNVKNGIVVAGNHLVYSNSLDSVAERKKQLQQAFPLESNVTFLDTSSSIENYSKTVDGILFLGTTLYCDYRLPTVGFKDGNKYAAIQTARNFMNDFRWGLRLSTKLVPEDYSVWFEESICKFENMLNENEKSANPKDVVVVTHFAPSAACVSQQYIYSPLNPVFASALDDFIIKHPSIKAWIYGHIHDQKIFKIGNCSLINNSRGYVIRNEDKNFIPELYLDTSNWKISSCEV